MVLACQLEDIEQAVDAYFPSQQRFGLGDDREQRREVVDRVDAMLLYRHRQLIGACHVGQF